MSIKLNTRRLLMEDLECRRLLSLTVGVSAISFEGVDGYHDGDQLIFADAKGGGGKPPGGPAIDLPTVVAHELGHSLGLPHSSDPSCGTANQPIMCAYYIGPAFRLMGDDVTKIKSMYPNSVTVVDSSDSRWDDPEISFSFMPDGASIDQGGRNGSELFSVMEKAIGTNWQSVFVQALNLWAEATDDALKFDQLPDDGSPFNASGSSQGDLRFGDIRFGSHKFDGPGGVLAHAYFPPPNGQTAAGDAHFAKEENWQNLSGLTLSASARPAASGGNLTSVHGRSGASDASAALRYSNQQFAADVQLPKRFAASGSIEQNELRPTDLGGVSAYAAERSTGSRDRQDLRLVDLPQRAMSSSRALIVATAPLESQPEINMDSAQPHDLLESWDEILLHWPA